MAARCKICRQPLTDPVSIALGVGPKCRGANGTISNRAKAKWKRIRCGQAYSDHRPFTVGDQAVPVTPLEEPDEYGNEWKYGDDGFRLTHEELGRWLAKSGLAVIEKPPVMEGALETAPGGA